MKTINSPEIDKDRFKEFEKAEFKYQKNLTEKLDGFDGDFDENIINEIVLWKVNRAPFIKPETRELINQIKKTNTDIDEGLTHKILGQLLAAPGFDLPMASTLLRFKNPTIYQIIDQRVFRFIYPKETLRLTGSVEKKIALYLKYLTDLKEICQNKGLEFSKIDRTLYLVDKELNKEFPLERYSTKPKK